ncbi:beta-propeller fold lactonase family protein [Actinomyces sp.]|uniref:lactonase family protein n=1 Tax=Actinomyces sp. TaxID=29317 RepID=UPI00289806F0|nr:beta-propeller fold lactonase family protein [Actinomyces sp.]
MTPAHSRPRTRTLWIGTFPVAGIGTTAGLGEGIWRTDLDLDSGQLTTAVQVCRVPAPSFLVRHPQAPVVYATAEAEPEGAVSVLAVEGDTLHPLSRVTSAGAAPTHLAQLPGFLVASNYADGTVGAVPLDAAGLPAGSTTALRHCGSGPRPDRQERSHAHSTTVAPGGRVALVCDLGTDELRRLRVVGGRLVEDGVAHRFPPGSGPRHAVFLPEGRYLLVVTELSSEVVLLEWDGEAATEVTRTDLAAGAPGPHLPSHLVLSERDDAPGYLLDVADRGPGVLVTLGVDEDGGTLEVLGRTGTGVSWPRHFAAIGAPDGRTLLVVAGETEGVLRVLERTPDSPLPRLLPGGTRVPSPAFVLEEPSTVA